MTKELYNIGSKVAKALHSKQVTSCNIEIPPNFKHEEIAKFLKAIFITNYKFE